MLKKILNFLVDNELFKRFSKKCIDVEKSKTEVLVKLIEDFVKQ